jgi:hypothetical protein
MAIPLSNEMKEVQAPRTAEIKPIDNQQLIEGMGKSAMQANKHMQDLFTIGFNFADNWRKNEDAFKRNEAERKYNERTTELNEWMAEQDEENRVKAQPKYEAEMKLASDEYEAAINKVHDFEIREGSKRHINAWNNRNASNYQYANYQNKIKMDEKALGQKLITGQQKRIEAINGFETPSSLVKMAMSDAYGYGSDAQAIMNYYHNERGENEQVAAERVRDFISKSAQGVAIRYAQLAKKNSPAADFKDAEDVYTGIAKAYGLSDSYTIEGRRDLQKSKIDAMAKDPVERYLLMTDGQFDLGKAHNYAPDLNDEERQKVLKDTGSGSGSGGKINKFASSPSAEEFWINVSNVDHEMWNEVSEKHPDFISDAVSKTDWGKTKYGDLFNAELRENKRKNVLAEYKKDPSGRLTQLLDFYWQGQEMLASGNLQGADRDVVQLITDALTNRLTNSVNSKDFSALLGDNSKRRNLPVSTNLQLTAIDNTIKMQGGEYKRSKLFGLIPAKNPGGRVVLNEMQIENAMRDARAAYSDTLRTFGQGSDKELNNSWWTTPQSITVMGTNSSTDNITGEKKSTTSLTPQQIQVIPLAYYANDYMLRQVDTVGKDYVLDNAKILQEATKDLSEWQKGAQDIFKGWTGAKTYKEEEYAKIRSGIETEVRTMAARDRAWGTQPGLGGRATFSEKEIQELTDQKFKEYLLSHPDVAVAVHTQTKARERADKAIRDAHPQKYGTGSNQEQAEKKTVNLSDLGLHGNIGERNSKPMVSAENGVRLQELDNILYSYGIGNFTYTSAMGGNHKEGERSHSAGQKVDFVTANHGRLPAELEKQLEAAGFWGKGTGAVGFEVDDPKTGKGHYDVSITTPKNYVMPKDLVARIAYADTPMHLTLNENDTPEETRYKNIFMDYRLGYGQNGMMTEQEFRRNYMGFTLDDNNDYDQYKLRLNTDRQTQEMYNDMYSDVTPENISMLPHVFDISENMTLQEMVRNKYKENSGEPNARKYIKYVSNDDIFKIAEMQEVGYATWADKSSSLYQQAVQYPKELRRNRGLFLTDTDTHYYYDGKSWNIISGDAGRIIGFMSVLDQKDNIDPSSPYSVLSRSISSLEAQSRTNAKITPVYNVKLGDVGVSEGFDATAFNSFKNITTTDWRKR